MQNCSVVGHITPEAIVAIAGAVGAIITIIVNGAVKIIRAAKVQQE